MREKYLPSGNKILNPLESESSSDREGESTSGGAMNIDSSGICPKCHQQMGFAQAESEPVYYCDPCRVTLPLSDDE